MSDAAPPVDSEVDLTDFSFMPLDVRRLRDSKLAVSSNGEGFRCAVLLWCAAWHQVPAGSLPDDDEELCALAGYGRAVGTWKKIRANALRGFSKASDNRLYHPVVTEKVLEAWQSKLEERYRRECDRLRKENKRHIENKEQTVRVPSFDEWNSERRAKGIPTERPSLPADVQRKSDGRRSDSVLKRQGRDREETGICVQSARTDAVPAESDGAVHGGDRGRVAAADDHATMDAIQSGFPKGPNPSNWIVALRSARRLVEDGRATWAELLDVTRRYARFVDAGGVSEPKYIRAAHNFFEPDGGLWSQPWDPPSTKAEAKRDANIDASLTWLAQQEAKDASG